jgi:hypothetical protein
MPVRLLRSMAPAVALSVLTLTAAPGCTAAPGSTVAPGSHAAAPGAAGARITPVTDISAGCAGNSSEVEEAFAPPGNVYAEWIGCGGIGFARSADSGRHFGARVTVPGSPGGSWDPAIAVAADGTVYAAFMHAAGYSAYPVIGTGPGYATYLRRFSIQRGWLGPAVKVSAAYGNVRIWPGDAFGLAVLPGGSICMTWGSALGARKVPAIYASVVTG